MPILVIVATIQPHDWHGARGEGMDVACDGIGSVLLIELQGASNDDAVVFGFIRVVVTAIKDYHATVSILNVWVRVGIEGCEHILDEEGAPGFILDGIAEGYGIGRGFLGLLADIQAEDARVLVIVDNLATLEEIYRRGGEIYELAHLCLDGLGGGIIAFGSNEEVEELAKVAYYIEAWAIQDIGHGNHLRLCYATEGAIGGEEHGLV